MFARCNGNVGLNLPDQVHKRDSIIESETTVEVLVTAQNRLAATLTRMGQFSFLALTTAECASRKNSAVAGTERGSRAICGDGACWCFRSG